MKNSIQAFIIISVVIICTFAIVYYLFAVQNLRKEALDPSTNNTAEEIDKDIMDEETKHSVPLEDIVGGGPPMDGIPSIDDPKYVSVSDASKFLKDDDSGISIDMDGVSRFYPYQILVWHEIVNDTVNGQRILVTYCPLCGSGIVFDPLVNDERVEFGTSGKLWNSNLVMYDRATLSYWSQALGEAIVGPMTGRKLRIVPYDLTTFGSWSSNYPDGEVLSKDTGAIRFYGRDPYADYHKSDEIIFPVDNKDDRLNPKELVFGIIINNKAKAYVPSKIKDKKEIVDHFEGEEIVLKYISELDAVQMFKKTDNKLERINPFTTYWFSWVAVHPQTELYK